MDYMPCWPQKKPDNSGGRSPTQGEVEDRPGGTPPGKWTICPAGHKKSRIIPEDEVRHRGRSKTARGVRPPVNGLYALLATKKPENSGGRSPTQGEVKDRPGGTPPGKWTICPAGHKKTGVLSGFFVVPAGHDPATP